MAWTYCYCKTDEEGGIPIDVPTLTDCVIGHQRCPECEAEHPVDEFIRRSMLKDHFDAPSHH